MLSEQALDVQEQLLRLVPPVEHPHTRRCAPSRVGRDHDRHLGACRAGGVRRPQRLRDRVGAVEHREVELGVEDALGQLLGRRLLHVEVASVEEEAGEPHEPRVAARHEHARTRLVLDVLERARPAVLTRVVGAARRPRDAIADLEPAAPALARGELDDLAGAAARHVRHGRTSCSIFITTWSASRKTASIGNRMKAVWMLQPGRRTMPSPARRYRRPRRIRRCARSRP